MDTLITQFNKSVNTKTVEYEFEAQIKGGDVTKLHYNQVIQWLLMAGFKMESTEGTDILRIQQHINQVTNRIELVGIESIQHFCRTEELINPTFIHKERTGSALVENYWTKLTLGTETKLDARPEMHGPKTYRLMNRVRLVSDTVPFKYDCTIVRTTESLEGLFTVSPKYEIEVEFSRGTKKEVTEQIQRAITYALRGIQRSNYPIGKKKSCRYRRPINRLPIPMDLLVLDPYPCKSPI